MVRHLLGNDPDWLLDTAILHRTGQTTLEVLGEIEDKIMPILLHGLNLSSLYNLNEVEFPGETITVQYLLEELHRSVFKELRTHVAVSAHRMLLQQRMLMWELQAYGEINLNLSVLRRTGQINSLWPQIPSAWILENIKTLKKELASNIRIVNDRPTEVHYQYLIREMDLRFFKQQVDNPRQSAR